MKLNSGKRTHCVTRVENISELEEIVGHPIIPALSIPRRGTVIWETETSYPQDTVDAIKERFRHSKCAMNVQNDWTFENDSYTDLAVF